MSIDPYVDPKMRLQNFKLSSVTENWYCIICEIARLVAWILHFDRAKLINSHNNKMAKMLLPSTIVFPVSRQKNPRTPRFVQQFGDYFLANLLSPGILGQGSLQDSSNAGCGHLYHQNVEDPRNIHQVCMDQLTLYQFWCRNIANNVFFALSSNSY